MDACNACVSVIQRSMVWITAISDAMKLQVIVSLFVGSSLLVGAATESSVPEQTNAAAAHPLNSGQLVIAALQKMTASLERAVPLLASIKDKPTAELHAFDVGNIFIDFETCSQEYEAAVAGLRDADLRRIAPNEFRRYKFLSKQFRVQCSRLSWANHYDCLDLRTAMGEEVKDHETEPEKERPLLPQEQVQQLAASVANAQALYLSRNRNVQGGPGFTRETAWVMLDPKMSVIAQEYEIMRQVIRQTPDRQSLVYEGERWYDLLEYDVKMDDVTYTVDQWFDITLHADTMSARAKAAAQQQAEVPTEQPAAPVQQDSPAAAANVVAVPAATANPVATPAPVTEETAVPTIPQKKSRRSRRREETPAQPQPDTVTNPAPPTEPPPAVEPPMDLYHT